MTRVSESRESLQGLRQQLQEQEILCSRLPSQQEAEQKIRELRAFREQWNDIQAELQLMPAEPQPPQLPQPFTGLDLETARQTVRNDAAEYAAASGSKAPLVLLAVGILGLISMAALIFLRAYVFAAIAGAAGLVAILWGFREKTVMKRQHKTLLEKYGHGHWKHWADPLEIFERELHVYRSARKEFQEICSDLDVRMMVLQKKRETLCGFEEPDAVLDRWEQIQKQWEAYNTLHRETMQAQSHYETLNAMVRPVEKPQMPDSLTQSEEETARLMTECAGEQQRLQNRLGQYQGRMGLLGNRETVRKQLDQQTARIAHLEQTYEALVIAQETLAEARAQLQRRFAPRITRKAQTILSRMTGGRYHSLTMGADFSLQAGAGQEATLHDALWRSDGTMDQLYLSLRLAVAEELTADAPLILDDALVRFDDQRMRSAVEILKEMGQTKQVICFTCQGREAEI